MGISVQIGKEIETIKGRPKKVKSMNKLGEKVAAPTWKRPGDLRERSVGKRRNCDAKAFIEHSSFHQMKGIMESDVGSCC